MNGAKFRTTTMRKIVDVLKDADSTLENEFQDKDDLIPRNLLNKIKKLTMEAKDSAQTQIMTAAFPALKSMIAREAQMVTKSQSSQLRSRQPINETMVTGKTGNGKKRNLPEDSAVDFEHWRKKIRKKH